MAAIYGGLGDAERCLQMIGQLLDRLKPAGLIFNIDSGGIPFSEIEAVMRYAADMILPGLRNKLASY